MNELERHKLYRVLAAIVIVFAIFAWMMGIWGPSIKWNQTAILTSLIGLWLALLGWEP